VEVASGFNPEGRRFGDRRSEAGGARVSCVAIDKSDKQEMDMIKELLDMLRKKL
jgi:hypothetical protein